MQSGRHAHVNYRVRAGLVVTGYVLLWVIIVLMMLVLAGCSHQARKFDVPSTAELRTAHAQLARQVATAKGSAEKAQRALEAAKTAHGTAKASHAEEAVIVAQLAPAVADLRMRVTAELRPEVDVLASKVEALEARNAQTATALDDTGLRIVEGEAEAADAVAAANQAAQTEAHIASTLAPEYLAKVEALARAANTAEQAWAKNSAEIVKLRTSSWLWRIGQGFAVLIIVGALFLKFTGRLAFTAAGVAAKLS